MKLQLLYLSTQHPKWIFWGLLLIVLIFSSALPQIQIDTDPENMLPSDNPERLFHKAVKRTFSMHDAIVIGVVNNKSIYNTETLADILSVTDFALNLEGVVAADVMSMATADNISHTKDGQIRFEWMMNQAPTTAAGAAKIQQAINRLPLLANTLVSENHQAAAIYVPIINKSESYTIAKQIQSHIDLLRPSQTTDDNWYITGLPVAENQFGHEMFVQMAIAAPLAGLMIFFLLWLFFRNLAFVTGPMIVAIATVLITMGTLIALGFTVHIMSSMIAIFLMPIAVVDTVHIMSSFADRYKPGDDATSVIRGVIDHLYTPMLFTSITSALGFFSLMLTPVPPVQIFGAFVGGGILLAFLLTIVFIPAYVVSIKNLSMKRENNPVFAASIKWIGQLSHQYAKLWLGGLAVLFLVSAYGISLIQINDNPIRWFKPDHELRIADKVLNQHFAGTYDAHLVIAKTSDARLSSRQAIDTLIETAISNDLISSQLRNWLRQEREAYRQGRHQNATDLMLALDDRLFVSTAVEAEILAQLLGGVEKQATEDKAFLAPATLLYIEALQQSLLNGGLVGKSNSLADVVKVVNRELHTGLAQDYKLPQNSNAVAQTLLQYQSSHRPNDLWHFVTPSFEQSLIWLQLRSGDNRDMSRVITQVELYVDSHPLPQGLEYAWAGKAYINVIWQEAMVAGMLKSLLGAFVIVFIMMAALFRSLAYGLLAMLPLTITITFIYGLIGWVGKDYDMPIAVLSALTLGLSVDFAIHFLERFRAMLADTGSIKQTLNIMSEEPSRAIARNAIVIALGFTPLLFAPLVPYITVGLFLASIMAVSALVTLIMLPAILSHNTTTGASL